MIAGKSAKKPESSFAEVSVDRIIIESFSNKASPYFRDELDQEYDEKIEKLRSRLKWHLDHSLSRRQKQVIRLYLSGKKQREIAAILGITQQVVSIYKNRAINKLRKALKI